MAAEETVAERFRPDPQAAAQARRFLRRALADTDGGPVGGHLIDDLIMGANELAVNAVLHARTEFTVRVRISSDRVRIEVSDSNTRMPQPCLAPNDATSGRGLAVIDGSGLQWGAERHTTGKTVWVQARRHP